MKKTIITLALTILIVSSASQATIFSDDFESGTLDQWTVGGRQTGRESVADIVFRNDSQMGHVYQDGLTEILISKTFDYRDDLNFSFDLETLIHSEDHDPGSAFYASAGASFTFLDSMSNELGVVRFSSSTSTYPSDVQNPLPNKHVFEIDGALASYSLDIEDILSNITIDQNALAAVRIHFAAYASGNSRNMSAHAWVDNVVVMARTLIGLEIEGPEAIAENSKANYKAITHYDIGSPKDVTDSVNWLVEPTENASITAGLLMTKTIDLPEDVTITAQYSEGDVDVSAQKDVSVLAICPSGSALEFDGVDDGVTVAHDNSLNFGDSTDFSIFCWAKYKPDGIKRWNILVDKRVSTSAGFVMGMAMNNDGRLFFYTNKRVDSDLLISDTEWHYIGIVVKRDSDTVTFYLDNMNDTKTFSDKNLDSIADMVIGERAFPEANHFSGDIDEVVIYNRALSREEVQAMMHIQPDLEDPTLVGYWDFDDAEGQVAADMSGYGNHGQLGVTGDVDESDPVWVTSDAPVGICTPEGIVERNLSGVMDIKAEILELLYTAISKEGALLMYMDEAFHNGEIENLSKGDVAKAKQKVHSAIQQEEQAETAIDQSIDKIDEAKNTLGIESQE
jgi:hypothetical protein